MAVNLKFQRQASKVFVHGIWNNTTIICWSLNLFEDIVISLKNFDPESKVYINVFLWHPVLLRVFWRGKAYYIRSSKLEKKSTSTQWGISRKFHSYWLQQFITSEILAPVKLTYIFQNSKTNIRFIIRFFKLITIEKLQKKAMLGCNENSNGCGKNFKTEIDFNL